MDYDTGHPLYPLPNGALIVETDFLTKTVRLKRASDWGDFPCATPVGFDAPPGFSVAPWPDGFEIPNECLPYSGGDCLNQAGPRPVLGCVCNHCSILRAQ